MPKFKSLTEYLNLGNEKDVLRRASTLEAVQYMVTHNNLFSEGRKIRMLSGLEALRTAFGIEELRLSSKTNESHFSELKTMPEEHTKLAIAEIYNFFLDHTDDVKDEDLKIALGWGLHCMYTALAADELVPDDDPFYLAPLKPDASDDDKILHALLEMASVYHTFEHFQNEPLKLVEIQLKKLEGAEEETSLAIKKCRECIDAARRPGEEPHKVDTYIFFAQFYVAIAEAYNTKNFQQLLNLYQMVPPKYRAQAEAFIRAGMRPSVKKS
jgi:hypothetical protein